MEIITFGPKRVLGKSVEQIAIQDYPLFRWLLNRAYSPNLKERFLYVDHVLNNFVSVKNCKRPLCKNLAQYMGLTNTREETTMDATNIFCSEEHLNETAPGTEKVNLEMQYSTFGRFQSITIRDTVLSCMGIVKGRMTKQYLEDFFDSFMEVGKLKNPYNTTKIFSSKINIYKLNPTSSYEATR